MKKISLVLMIILVVFSLILVGCQKTTDGPTSSPLEIGEDTATAETPTLEDKGVEETQIEESPKLEVKEEVKPVEPAIEEGVVEVSMIAKKWEFIPAEIKVKKGDKVKLTISSEDVDHGIALAAFDINVKFKPGETKTVEFVADKVGTYTFSCNVFCGEGHGGMKGKLIVE
ncbi:cupredoxin domain-containing protein [Candidatus Woesearchaeota archaeon]|nr:cupredoxin domain-containing protein [Candidatus Woesearchaeota archaeon]